VALLNDALLRAHKPALGFLNPFLYEIGYRGLNDITGGQSNGCQGYIPGAHWNATKGWDPTTGLGTPDFQKLKEIVLAL
jgi:tripeptidyl-peptidase-1